MGLMFLGLAGALTAVYVVNLGEDEDDVGITSLVAGLLTFVFGALAGFGEVAIAGAAAVITTLLLGYKPLLHHWVSTLKGKELRAGLKLLLISVVLLPILPNQGYGPWQALNPYEIWWMVVLVATISFVGYFAIKFGGAQQGHGVHRPVRWSGLVHGDDAAFLARGAQGYRDGADAGDRHPARLRHHVSAHAADCGGVQQAAIPATAAAGSHDGDAGLCAGAVLLVVIESRRNTMRRRPSAIHWRSRWRLHSVRCWHW